MQITGSLKNHTHQTQQLGFSEDKRSGWVKFPNGLIIQWGSHTHQHGSQSYVTSGGGTVKFPIPFPNKVIWVGLTQQDDSWQYDAQLRREGLTNSQFKTITQKASASSPCLWIAFGY